MSGPGFCHSLVALSLGIASTAQAQVASAPPCGTVVLFDRNVPADHVYPVGIIDIDGKQPFRGRTRYALAPGKHVLGVGEIAPESELSYQVQRNTNRHIRNRTFEIEIQPDKVYVIAALFDPENETDPKAYWRPVLLAETAGACKP
jgi:hypothetical protein